MMAMGGTLGLAKAAGGMGRQAVTAARGVGSGLGAVGGGRGGGGGLASGGGRSGGGPAGGPAGGGGGFGGGGVGAGFGGGGFGGGGGGGGRSGGGPAGGTGGAGRRASAHQPAPRRSPTAQSRPSAATGQKPGGVQGRTSSNPAAGGKTGQMLENGAQSPVSGARTPASGAQTPPTGAREARAIEATQHRQRLGQDWSMYRKEPVRPAGSHNITGTRRNGR